MPRDVMQLAVSSMTDAAVARTLVVRIGTKFGLDRVDASQLALATSELVTNVVKYCGGGELRVSIDGDALVVTALDRGPGPPSEAELFGDGISRGRVRAPDHAITTGRGTGGAALRRLCDEVSVGAREGGGSVISCRKHRPAR